MKPGSKELLVPLRRENRGIHEDPQYSPYFPSERYGVFSDYGHPDHLAYRGFRTKREAEAWIVVEKARLEFEKVRAGAKTKA